MSVWLPLEKDDCVRAVGDWLLVEWRHDHVRNGLDYVTMMAYANHICRCSSEPIRAPVRLRCPGPSKALGLRYTRLDWPLKVCATDSEIFSKPSLRVLCIRFYPFCHYQTKFLYFVIVHFLVKLFNINKVDIINNCRQYFDVKLPSIFWSDRISRFEKTFVECDNIFLQNFSFNSIAYIYSLLSVFLFSFHVYLLPFVVNKDVH